MYRWHCYYEREHIVNERIERFVHKRTPRQCSNRFQFIIDEQLRQHEQKTKRVHPIHQRV